MTVLQSGTGRLVEQAWAVMIWSLQGCDSKRAQRGWTIKRVEAFSMHNAVYLIMQSILSSGRLLILQLSQ